MSTENKTSVTVNTLVNAPIERVWAYWNQPRHITRWCAASDDWHAPHAENDLRVGGKSKTVMAARDGSHSFDLEWTYTLVDEPNALAYTLADDRKVSVRFSETPQGVEITETFDTENTNPVEMQRAGWQAILDHFKRYAESNPAG